MPGRHRLPAPAWKTPLICAMGAALVLLGCGGLVAASGGGLPAEEARVVAAVPLALRPATQGTTEAAPSSTTTRRPPGTSASRTAPRTTTPRPSSPSRAVASTTTTTRPPPATTAAPRRTAVATARTCPSTLEGTQPHVAQVGHHLMAKFDIDDVHGRGDRPGPSDHPDGLALDFMVDRATGDALADYILAHRRDFAVTYLIWRQRFNDGSGWSPMADRGSITANHYDHVHVSFAATGPVAVSC